MEHAPLDDAEFGALAAEIAQLSEAELLDGRKVMLPSKKPGLVVAVTALAGG
jgi:hypothetical protein